MLLAQHAGDEGQCFCGVLYLGVARPWGASTFVFNPGCSVICGLPRTCAPTALLAS